MASAPQPNLPLFFKDLMPLNSKDHANYRTRPMAKAPWLAKQHAVPLTVDEFVQAQRDMPIVFSTGSDPVPLALMGLNDGVNTFVDDEPMLCRSINQLGPDAIRALCKARLDLDVEDPVIVAVDPLGVDVRARFDILRLPFGTPIEDPDRVLDIVRNWARI